MTSRRSPNDPASAEPTVLSVHDILRRERRHRVDPTVGRTRRRAPSGARSAASTLAVVAGSVLATSGATAGLVAMANGSQPLLDIVAPPEVEAPAAALPAPSRPWLDPVAAPPGGGVLTPLAAQGALADPGALADAGAIAALAVDVSDDGEGAVAAPAGMVFADRAVEPAAPPDDRTVEDDRAVEGEAAGDPPVDEPAPALPPEAPAAEGEADTPGEAPVQDQEPDGGGEPDGDAVDGDGSAPEPDGQRPAPGAGTDTPSAEEPDAAPDAEQPAPDPAPDGDGDGSAPSPGDAGTPTSPDPVDPSETTL